MKRPISLFCALTLIMSLALPARAAAGSAGVRFFDEELSQYGPVTPTEVVRVTVDGAPLEMDVPAVIRVVEGDGRTMIPVRAIAEALGATVLWMAENRQVVLFHGEDTIVLTLGSAQATVNEEQVTLPGGVPAGVADLDGAERTMVPLRFVSEQLHAQVGWDNDTRTASVTTPDATPAPAETPPSTEAPASTETPAPTETPAAAETPEPTATAEPQPSFAPLPDLSGHSVMLDAGHGGWSTGAVYEGIREKDINLAVTLRVAELLEATGCRVDMIRTTDKFVDIYDRCDIANQTGSEIYVSIHCNATDVSSTFAGTYTYYYRGSAVSKSLASAIQKKTSAYAGSVDRGLMDSALVVVKYTWMPAALVELGFMTCHEELMLLNDPAYQEKLAQGVAAGISDYLVSRS